MTADYPALYKKYFVDRNDERLGLFQAMAGQFDLHSGLYPGSFVHITPSLVFPHMVYVDMDKRCAGFFRSDAVKTFVEKSKLYREPSTYRFSRADFTEGLQEREGSFDILISLYAGFISKYCGEYVKKGGILLTNNSHGDAPLAYLDERFEFIGVVQRSGNRFSCSDTALDSYFVPKGRSEIERESIERTMRGPAYTNPAYAYLFRKLG